MTTQRVREGVVVLALAAVLAATARADLGPPVTVTLVGTSRPAEAGQRFEDTARFTAARDLVLSAVEVGADPAWTVVSLFDPGPLLLEAGQYVDVPFAVIANDPEAAPLTFAFRFDDLPATADISLSPLAFAEGRLAQPTGAVVPDGPAAAPATDDLPRPGPAANAVENGPSAADADAAGKAGRWITVHGRFFYERPDLVSDGADGMTVEVFADGLKRAAAVTAPDGTYSATFFWVPATFWQDLNPDLRVEFVSDSAKVQTRNAAGFVLRWVTPTWPNYAGGDLDVGWQKPKDAAQHVYVHGHTVVTRAWRWVLLETGVDWLKVNLMRSAKDGQAWYGAGSKTIVMSTDRMWQEITVVHECGHHFLEWHASGVMGPSQYCNNVCDGGPGCGHCTWCVEDAEDAWNEGFPTWMGTMVGRILPAMYGVQPNSMLNFEYLQLCGDNTPATFDDPWRNEGPFVALLWDIVDANNEDDTLTPATTGWSDRLTLDTSAIWDVVWGDAPLTPQDFITGFLGNNGSLREDFWETARNNGYEIDAQEPPVPFLLSSTSHVHNVPSTDGTVDLYWLGALDDASGIAGYGLRMTPGAPAPPPYYTTCGDVNTLTTANLAPGAWWFTLRALDRAGHWSSGYATYGPIIVAEPSTVEVATFAPPDWALPLVPGPAPYGGLPVPPPAALVGGADTWWNLGVINRGSDSTTGDMRLDLRVDGRTLGATTIPATAPLRAGMTATFADLGPVVVPGGRHTFGTWLDAGEATVELDEADNHWAWQWLWEPAELAVAPTADHGVPPPVTGGWENLAGGAVGHNVDAFRLRVAAGSFHGLCLFAADDAADFDLQLHEPSDDPQSGLDTWLGGSGRLAGQLDAVLVRAGASEIVVDAAVLNYSGHDAPARLSHVAAEPFALGGDVALSFAADEMLKLGVLTVPPGQEGPLTLRLAGDPADGALSLAWFGAWAGAQPTYANLDGWAAYARTDADGLARLDLVAAEPGDYGFALYRHPLAGRQPRPASFRATPALPDPAPMASAGWHAPLVPRAQPDGLPVDVAPPGELFAAPAPTWLNAAAVNAGAVDWPPNPCSLRIDGVEVLSWDVPALGPGGVALLNATAPALVAGGRHTAGMLIDPAGSVAEEDDANNGWASQWVWTPEPLAPGGAAVVAYPPNPCGGWEAVTEPGMAGLAVNCVGYRFGGAPDGSTRAGQWVGLAALPTADEDCDVALHEAATGAQDGFRDADVLSGWPAGECDFVLVNYERTTPRAFDAGVRRFDGTGPALVAAAASAFLGVDPVGASATFSLPAVQGLALHEVWLSSGVWGLRLENLDGQVDYGLSVHPGDLPFGSRSHVIDGGSAWMAGPGQDEDLVVTVEEARHLCVAVWKRTQADWAMGGSYRLVLTAGVTPAAGDAAPMVTRVDAARPNPFNPRVTVDFTVGSAGRVEFAVFDVLGRRVRRLVAADLGAGSHQVVWDGLDDVGRPVASGTYLLRLDGPDGVSARRRVTMLK